MTHGDFPGWIFIIQELEKESAEEGKTPKKVAILKSTSAGPDSKSPPHTAARSELESGGG